MESRVFGFFIALFLVFSTSTLIRFGVVEGNCYKSDDIGKICDNGWLNYKYDRATKYCKSECAKRGNYKWGECNLSGLFSGAGVCHCYYQYPCP